MKRFFSPKTGILIATALVLATPIGHAGFESSFDVDTDGWRTSDASASLTHQAAGGASGGHIRGQAAGIAWSFVSPESWAGDWSSP